MGKELVTDKGSGCGENGMEDEDFRASWMLLVEFPVQNPQCKDPKKVH